MKVQTTTLKNGLRLVLVPCEAQSVAFGLFVGSGSRHESERTAGISHFIEHMLFKGTPTRSPLQISQAIEGRGGNFNACTNEESTAFYAHLPDDYLDEAIDIICDMYLHATFAEDEFAREKQVVIEEIKMYGDDPDSVAAENLQRALFSQSRLGAPVAGSAASLLPLKPSHLKAYLKSHYLPSNTIAVVVGHFDEQKAIASVARRMGSFRRSAKSLQIDNALAGRPTAEVTAEKDVMQAQLALGYRTFGIGDRRKYVATVFDAIMGRGMSSRLFQQVRERRGLSYDITSRMQFFQDAGMWAVAAGMDPSKAQLTLTTIDRELKRIVERKVPASELERTKEFLVGNFRLSSERIISKLFFYGGAFLSFDRLVDPQEQIDGIMAVTADDVQGVAREILRPENRSVSWVFPRKK